MKIQKVFAVAVVMGAFGLVACGDDSSSGSMDPNLVYCKITSESPYTMKMSASGVTVEEALSYDGMDITMRITTTYPSQTMADFYCEDAEYEAQYEDYMDVVCDGKSVAVTEKDEGVSAAEFKMGTSLIKSMCEEINGMTLEEFMDSGLFN